MPSNTHVYSRRFSQWHQGSQGYADGGRGADPCTRSGLFDRDAIIERKEGRIIRLEKLRADFKRALYGAKSEKGHPDQYQLALEDIETAMAVVHAEDDAIDPPAQQSTPNRRTGRGALPKHSVAGQAMLASPRAGRVLKR